MLNATARPARGERQGFNLTALPGLRTLLVDDTGRQHVVLHTHACTMQIVIDGADVRAGQVNLDLVIPATRLGNASRQLVILRRFLAGDPLAQRVPPWSRQTLQLRNAIIALDGRAARATHREVAVVIYGEAKVAEDWIAAGLRDRVRRDLARGIALATNGYRDLLRQGW